MDLGISDRVKPLIDDIQRYIDDYIVPNEGAYARQVEEGGRWTETAVMEEVKDKAKERGLWNFFLPNAETGEGLSNLDYAYIAIELGKNPLASESMNCSAHITLLLIIKYFRREEEGNQQETGL